MYTKCADIPRPSIETQQVQKKKDFDGRTIKMTVEAITLLTVVRKHADQLLKDMFVKGTDDEEANNKEESLVAIDF